MTILDAEKTSCLTMLELILNSVEEHPLSNVDVS